MTDKPMTMRDRLVCAIAENAHKQAQAYGAMTPYADADRPNDAILDGHFDLYQFVDAMLDVMEAPSEAAINTILGESVEVFGSAYNAYGPLEWHLRAMVKAIREGY